jgi:3,4-dihydroxy 2-butanone 4-phosphate synthase / GTP cyclohydrolase II
MNLTHWLKRNRVKRVDFAARIGVSPGAVTQLCNNEAPWLSRETAGLILRETGGAVTPNDFLGLPPDRSLDMHSQVTAAIAAMARGELVIVTDDDDRENEGDLIMAASLATPEKMAFIIRNTCGIVCAPLPLEDARRLRLAPMVADNDSMHTTAFTVTVDYRHGTTTGISADDRTATVRGLANGNAGAADFSRPGHIFPLIAREGGVLIRSGHTEAAVDLCRLAGQPPVGVICELVNDDGTVMKGAQINAFAEKHKLVRITVDDLIAYRQAREKLVERVATFTIETAIGEMTGHAYVTPFDKVQHFAFVYGAVGEGRDMPARLHRANVIADMFGGAKAFNAALAHFAAAGRGVVVYLRDGTAGVPTSANPGDGEQGQAEASRSRQWREVGLGAQILRDIGVYSIINLTSTPRPFVGLSGFGIEISGTLPLSG